MPETYRILTTPVRLAGGVPLSHLAMLVCADAQRRWARAQGDDVVWQAVTVAGDLASQYAVEQELAREGHDRESVSRDEFVERVRTMEADARDGLSRGLASLGVEVEPVSLDGPEVQVAAATAFVRLFEEGLIHRAERVVTTCPRCATVVEAADAVGSDVTAEVLTLRLALDHANAASGDAAVGDSAVGEAQANWRDPELLVEVVAAELLPGVVAVAVPEGHPAAGGVATLPLSGEVVPVLADASVAVPRLVVPAHDSTDLELARAAGTLVAPEVLDGLGMVAAQGPLRGLGRFAARSAAAAALEAEGALAGRAEATEEVGLCRRCGTVLVPRLGWHWFLSVADLEVAAADAARQGVLTFAPPGAVEAFLERAGNGGEWCLSHQVWAGHPVPVSTCQECGLPSVEVYRQESCGRCMGELVADPGALDARFVGAVWALAAGGWPESGEADPAATTLAVGVTGVVRWALPMAALGLRLAGATPFTHVAVQEPALPEDADDGLTVPPDVLDLVRDHGSGGVRVALLDGRLDCERGRAVAAALASPPEGDGDVGALSDQCEAAFAAATPAVALGALEVVIAAGVPADRAGELHALAAPIVGT